MPLRDGPTPWAACQPMVVGLSEAADSTMDSASWGFSKLDLTQNLEKAMHAITLARCRLGLALEGFSLSATALDIRELPAALRHPLADARWKCVSSGQATAAYLTPFREHCQRHHAPQCHGVTPTVHAGRHSSTLKDAAHHHGGRMMRRRYSRFTVRLTVAGDTLKDLATRRWLTPLATISITAASCSSDNRRGAPSFLPSAFAFSKPALVRRRIDTSSWSDTQAAKPARV